MFHTVDSVIRDFTKASAKLRKLVSQHEGDYNYHADAADFHKGEANRARKIADNIDNIVKV